MASEDEDLIQVVLPDDQKAAFREALAAAASEENVSAPVVDESPVSDDQRRALNFEPTTAAIAFVVLKFAAEAIAAHLICKAFDKLVLDKFKKFIVIDPQGRQYEVKAENLDQVRQQLVKKPKT